MPNSDAEVYKYPLHWLYFDIFDTLSNAYKLPQYNLPFCLKVYDYVNQSRRVSCGHSKKI